MSFCVNNTADNPAPVSCTSVDQCAERQQLTGVRQACAWNLCVDNPEDHPLPDQCKVQTDCNSTSTCFLGFCFPKTVIGGTCGSITLHINATHRIIMP